LKLWGGITSTTFSDLAKKEKNSKKTKQNKCNTSIKIFPQLRPNNGVHYEI
jgi:hypothetical protein